VGGREKFKVAVTVKVLIEVGSVRTRKFADIIGNSTVYPPYTIAIIAYRADFFGRSPTENFSYRFDPETCENAVYIVFEETPIAPLSVKSAYHCDSSGGFGGAGVFFHESFLTCSAADIHHGRPQLFETLDKGDFFDLTVPDVRLETLLGEH